MIARRGVHIDDLAKTRLKRLRPSSPERLERWANAIRGAYFEREGFDWRDRNIGSASLDEITDADFDKNGRPIIPRQSDFRRLLARIDRKARLQVRRGGRRGDVYSAIISAFYSPSPDEEKRLRYAIIELAEVGKFNPKRAQLWAHRLGVPQFAKLECRVHCDPMQEAEWSLLMAAVWIQWRDLRLVARVSPVSENFLPTWVKIEHENGSTGYGLYPDDDLEDAKPQLVQYLRSGVSPASGFCKGERRQIAPVEWRDMKIAGRYEREGFATVMSPNGERDIYERVSLPRDDLLVTFRLEAITEVATVQAIAATIENVKAELLREADEHGGKILGQTKALKHIKECRFVGHDLQGTVRRAVRELSGGRRPGER